MIKLSMSVFLVVLAAGCLTEDEVDLGADQVALMIAEKIKITDDGLTKCDGDNSKCFDALKNEAKNCSNTTGAEQQALKCWCTHCDNGNFCESYSDHQSHDDKCTLTPKTAADEELAVADEPTLVDEAPAWSDEAGAESWSAP